MSDRRKTTVFPTSTTNAFAYTATGYVTKDTLEYGTGYWLRFPATEVVALAGGSISGDTIDVVQGWNMIGSISGAVPVGDIVQVPGGIVVSQYFGYSASGYGGAQTIHPMRGYWVKVNQNGQLILQGGVISARKHGSGQEDDGH
jgi:hypothetical protein